MEENKVLERTEEQKASKPSRRRRRSSSQLVKKAETAEKRQGSTKQKVAKEKNDKPQEKKVETEQKKSTSRQQANRAGRQKRTQKPLKIIPLGGLLEIGKNLTVLEYGNDILLIDCGFAFPSEDMYGIDYVIPDLSYLIRNKDKIRGIVLTHGHEDHIGALPYLLKEIKPPLYGGMLTLGIVQYKLDEHHIQGVHMQRVRAGETIKAGCFEVTFFSVCHSIADAFGVIIKTPVGIVVHTGDFKIDHTPIGESKMDLVSLAEAGKKGVLLLMSDSTNADRPGYTPSEQKVAQALDQCIREAEGRVIVASFSSNVSRIQQVINSAEKQGRKIYFAGRSMIKIFEIASELGYIRVKPGSLVDDRHLDYLDPDEVVIITTGSQGEPMSGLVRMSNDDHRYVKLQAGDTVVISASPIPGNEKAVTSVIDKLYQKGINVVYHSNRQTHVSGHSCQEEQKMVLALTRPRYFMPVHGEFHHLRSHARTAMEIGIPEENVMLAHNGDVIEVTREKISVADEVPAEGILIDGGGIGDVGNVVLRDRRLLSSDGIFIVVAAIDKRGEIVSGPDVISRGFVYVRESEALMQKAREIAQKAILAATDGHTQEWSNIKNSVRTALKNFLYDQTKRTPIIIPILVEVDLEEKK